MSEMINLDAVTEGLRTIASLRNGVSDLFKCLTEGVGGPVIDPYSGQPKTSDADPTEEAEKQFLSDVQGIVEGITNKILTLERSCDLLSHPSAQVSVHLSLLGQDPALERNGVYKSVVSCYRWCDRMHDYVTQASHILNQNICRRSTIALDPHQRILIPGGIGRRASFATINTPSSQIDAFFNNLSRIHPNVTLEISRPFGAPTIVFITLDRILKGCLLLHGLLIEWVIVKGMNEEFKTADGTVDIWSDSRYEVFRKISDHCNSATLNFATPVHVDLAVRSWLNWFINYNTLFTKPCRKCNHRLLDASPPTWRDFRTADCYHEKCRP